MSGTRIAGIAYLIWFIGFAWMAVTTHRIDDNIRQLYFWLPILGPLVIIGILSVLVWIGQALGKIDH